LADANKEQILWEEAVTERLRTMSAAAAGKCFALSFLLRLLLRLLFSLILCFPPLLCRFYRSIFIVFETGR
jgi:hypothetical protein